MAALSINVFENPAVFDNLSDYPDLVDTNEVVTVILSIPNISVVDTPSTSENTNVNLVDLSSVFDSVTTVEQTSLSEVNNVNVFDSSTVTENLNENKVLNVNLARSGVRIV